MAVMRHDPRVRRQMSEAGMTYQMRCVCGVCGPIHPAHSLAVGDRQAHIDAVAAPVEERCRRVEEHQPPRWWEACLLCSAQPALPGLEEVRAP